MHVIIYAHVYVRMYVCVCVCVYVCAECLCMYLYVPWLTYTCAWAVKSRGTSAPTSGSTPGKDRAANLEPHALCADYTDVAHVLDQRAFAWKGAHSEPQIRGSTLLCARFGFYLKCQHNLFADICTQTWSDNVLEVRCTQFVWQVQRFLFIFHGIWYLFLFCFCVKRAWCR